MDKLVAVVFSNEKAAYEGVRVLSEMDADGSIDVAMVCMITKAPDGGVSTKQVNDSFPIRALGGTTVGALPGLFAGAVGAGVGAAVGAFAGMVGDLYSAGVDQDFISDVATALTPGKCAVVAEVDEESVTPLDMRIEALDGVVYRTLKSTARDERWKRDTDNVKAQLNQLKREFAEGRADRKAKLEAQIERLKKGIEAKLARLKDRSQQVTGEYEAKVQALQQKADKQQGKVKAAIETRIAKLRQDYQSRTHA